MGAWGEELGAACHEAEELRRRLNEVEHQREALSSMAALSIFHIVRAEEPLLTDRLRALPDRIRAAVSLGARRGAATALASIQLRFGTHLGEFEPGFPKDASAATRRTLMLNFSGFGAVAATEVDVDDILLGTARTRAWTAFERRGGGKKWHPPWASRPLFCFYFNIVM